MGNKHVGEYPAGWTKEYRVAFRKARGNRCERCQHPDDAAHGYALTIHHLDCDKANCEEWNLAALCQRCHLKIQGKVNMFQDFMLSHSPWMQPHVDGRNKAMAEGRWPAPQAPQLETPR